MSSDHTTVTQRIYELTPEEVELISIHCADQARRAAAEAFQGKAIATANAFAQWSSTTGEGLTFSTFINSFNYQDADGTQIYEAVKRIFDAAWPTSLEK